MPSGQDEELGKRCVVGSCLASLISQYTMLSMESIYMRRALELAALGGGHVSPNPMVGCVIVHQGKIIGEGWHKAYGQAHAEVNAIDSVEDKALLKESDVYVTLEPCAHYGKTPPCADLLAEHQVRSVTIAATDTNPLVGGKGIERLKSAGVLVKTGLLESECRGLNKRFFTYMEKQRPYVMLKWAETADGFIARGNFDSKWISSAYSRRLVHKWRAEEAAILVGTNTAHYDNPSLTVRDWSGKNPVRVVIDRHLRLNSSLHLFDRLVPTLCYNLVRNAYEDNLELIKLEEENFVQQLLQDLYKRKISSVMVEGGTSVLNLFIQQGLWDEARIFRSFSTFGKGIEAPPMKATLVHQERLPGGDMLAIYEPLSVV